MSYMSSISKTFMGSKTVKLLATLMERENASGAGSCWGSPSIIGGRVWGDFPNNGDADREIGAV